MDQIYQVNEVVDDLINLHGHTIQIMGLLQVGFENCALSHIPRSEQRPWYESSLWLTIEDSAKAAEYTVFEGRNVTVTGTVNAQETGHFGLWPGGVTVHAVCRRPKG